MKATYWPKVHSSLGGSNAEEMDAHPGVTVLLLGRTGDGKSSLGNMLLRKENDLSSGGPFETSSSLTRATTRPQVAEDLDWRVIDTVGLSSLENEASDRMLCEQLYHILVGGRLQSTGSSAAEIHWIDWICYVKKASKFTGADERCWKEFLRLFGKLEENIVLVFTGCSTDDWVEKNREHIDEHFGKKYSKRVGVNFPPQANDHDEEKIRERTRRRSLETLQKELRKRPKERFAVRNWKYYKNKCFFYDHVVISGRYLFAFVVTAAVVIGFGSYRLYNNSRNWRSEQSLRFGG